jgi:hypothetical protein
MSRANRRNAARKKRRASELPNHLWNLSRGRGVHPDVAPIADAARDEYEEMLEALGGVEHVSPQRLAILEDLVGVGLVLRSELCRYAITRDTEIVPKITSCAHARRASFAALGLDRVAREVTPTLADYLRSRENGTATVDLEPEREVSPTTHPSAAENALTPNTWRAPSDQQTDGHDAPATVGATGRSDARVSEPEALDSTHGGEPGSAVESSGERAAAGDSGSDAADDAGEETP